MMDDDDEYHDVKRRVVVEELEGKMKSYSFEGWVHQLCHVGN